MDKFFHVRLSREQGGECIELSLPAAPQELWEVMDRLGLSEGEMPECEMVRFGDSPEWRCSPEPPDVFQFNDLAERLAGFTDEEWTAFNELLAMEKEFAEMPVQMSRIIDLAILATEEHTQEMGPTLSM